MLKGKLLHPEILEALGRAGHNSKIMIADGNYPFSTAVAPRARQVYLNLSPGMVKVTDVLRVLVDSIPIEAARVMQPDEGAAPPIFEEFRSMLPPQVELEPVERYAFYNAVRDETVALLIATGEERLYANLLLTIGYIPPSSAS